MNDDLLRELKKSIDKLTAQEKKSASIRWAFLRGMLYGLGFFIGSALLVAVFLSILSLFDTVPIIGKYVARIAEFVSNYRGQ